MAEFGSNLNQFRVLSKNLSKTKILIISLYSKRLIV